MIETTRIIPLKTPKFDLKEQVIHEILFSPDSSLLLVATHLSGHIWSLKDGSIRASEKFVDGKLRKWLNHPAQDELLLSIGSADVRVFRWQDLRECSEPVSYLHMDSVPQENVSISDSNSDVDTAFKLLKTAAIAATEPPLEKVRGTVTQDLKHVLIQLSSNLSFAGFNRYFIVPLSELDSVRPGAYQGQNDPVVVRSATIPDDVRSRVRIALGVLPGDRFVFLDRELWLSSYKMEASSARRHHHHQSTSTGNSSRPSKQLGIDGDERVQRHYFIPDDWAMGLSLILCCMTADGTLFYPRDEKLSIIKASLSRPAYRRGPSTS